MTEDDVPLFPGTDEHFARFIEQQTGDIPEEEKKRLFKI